MIAVLPAPHGRHAAHRTHPSRLRALRHPLRALQARRWTAALRRDAAALAQSDREFDVQRRQWQLRMGRQLRAAPTLTDMTVTVRRPEFADVPQAAIFGGRWWQ